MCKRYKNVIRNFFSDYVSWLLIITLVFAVSFALLIAIDHTNGIIWAFPVLFLIFYVLASFPFLPLYCKVRKDIKKGKIDTLMIKSFKIEEDGTFQLKNKGGGIVGKRKYRIIDEQDNYYLLSASSDRYIPVVFYPGPTFFVEIEVSRTSRLVLSMKLIEDPKVKKETKPQEENRMRFIAAFSQYL